MRINFTEQSTCIRYIDTDVFMCVSACKTRVPSIATNTSRKQNNYLRFCKQNCRRWPETHSSVNDVLHVPTPETNIYNSS